MLKLVFNNKLPVFCSGLQRTCYILNLGNSDDKANTFSQVSVVDFSFASIHLVYFIILDL